ncbi:MAG: hypothetical protein WDZ41_01715 [Candidatus Babeliales bacterium]
MDLQIFLSKASNRSFFYDSSVIIFSGTSYPLLFCSLLQQKIRNITENNYCIIDLEQMDIEQFCAQVSMPFLGSTFIYWCGNIGSLDQNKIKIFLNFLSNYNGPHVICFFYEKTTEKMKKTWLAVELPAQIDQNLFYILYRFLLPNFSENKKNVLAILFEKQSSISLEVACLLMHYFSFLNKNTADYFMRHWFCKIVIPDKSLFTLSTYFFAKKSSAFLNTWQVLSTEYPAMFWLSFWSDQLFKAAHFVKLARKNDFLSAKKIAYRLPFPFIKKDWQLYQAVELMHAHHFLYDLDYHIKNGGSEIYLDLFYAQFFSNNFANN